MPPRLLFVYGTLLSGESALPHWQKVVHARLLGRAWTGGLLYDLGRYPGAIFYATGPAVIHGEVYRLPNLKALDVLDAYEELDPIQKTYRAFVRQVIPVETEALGALRAWVYRYRGFTYTKSLIPDGRWQEYRRARQRKLLAPHA